MTDLTLRRGAAADSALAVLAQTLQALFAATPLGILLAVVRDRR